MLPLVAKGVGERGEHDHHGKHNKRVGNKLGDNQEEMSGCFPGVEGGWLDWGSGGSGEPPPRKYRGDRHTPRKSLCTCVCACGARCQAEWKLQAASADGHKLPCSFLPRGSCTRMSRRLTLSHTHTQARTKTCRGIHNSKHPAPLSDQPPTTGEASPTQPPLHTFKSQSGRKLPPAPPPPPP